MFIHKLHTCVNTIFLFFCSGKSEFTDEQKNHAHKYLYFNNFDTFLDIPKNIRNELVECQKTQPCRSGKEAVEYHVMNVFGRAW